MAHDLLESTLNREKFDLKTVNEDIERLIAQYLIRLYAVNQNETMAKQKMNSFIPNLQLFFENYVPSMCDNNCNNNQHFHQSNNNHSTHKPYLFHANTDSLVYNQRQNYNNNNNDNYINDNKKNIIDWGGGNKQHIEIKEIIDTEESIWSPMFGIQGNLNVFFLFLLFVFLFVCFFLFFLCEVNKKNR